MERARDRTRGRARGPLTRTRESWTGWLGGQRKGREWRGECEGVAQLQGPGCEALAGLDRGSVQVLWSGRRVRNFSSPLPLHPKSRVSGLVFGRMAGMSPATSQGTKGTKERPADDGTAGPRGGTEMGGDLGPWTLTWPLDLAGPPQEGKGLAVLPGHKQRQEAIEGTTARHASVIRRARTAKSAFVEGEGWRAGGGNRKLKRWMLPACREGGTTFLQRASEAGPNRRRRQGRKAESSPVCQPSHHGPLCLVDFALPGAASRLIHPRLSSSPRRRLTAYGVPGAPSRECACQNKCQAVADVEAW